MNWLVVVRAGVEEDIATAAAWYEARQPGLGDTLEQNPLLNARQHPSKNIRWRYPERFPYRVIYEVIESDRTVIVAAVVHAARHDRVWRERV